MYSAENARLLDTITDISDITMESELSVLAELGGCYEKAVSIIAEATDIDNIEGLSIFQEGIASYNIGKKVDEITNKMDDFSKSKTEGNLLKRIGLGFIKGVVSIIVKIVRFFQGFANRKDKATIEQNVQAIQITDEDLKEIFSDIDESSDNVGGFDFSEDEFTDADLDDIFGDDDSDFEVTPIDDDDEYIMDENGRLVKKKKDDSVTEESYFDNIYTELIMEATEQKSNPAPVKLVKKTIQNIGNATLKVCSMQAKSLMMVTELVKTLKDEATIINLMNAVNKDLNTLLQQTAERQYAQAKKNVYQLIKIIKFTTAGLNKINALMEKTFIGEGELKVTNDRLAEYNNKVQSANDVNTLKEASKGVTSTSIQYMQQIDNNMDASKTNFDRIVKFMNAVGHHLSTFSKYVEQLTQKSEAALDQEFMKAVNELNKCLHYYFNTLAKITVFINKSFTTMNVKLNHMLKANQNSLKSN